MLNNNFRRVHTHQATPVTRAPATDARFAAHQRMNRLRLRRGELFQALRQLDAATDQHAYRQIMQWVNEEYEARQGGTIMGLFAKCYLGPPYVDHRLDLLGSICEHFTPADPVPVPYGQARALAQSGAYAHIEIYSDGSMVPVLPDGTAVEL
ncbi:MAG: hypothetical protein QM662_15045 [Gordonia sp. (in: high G+C Gram-positive bacteria)]